MNAIVAWMLVMASLESIRNAMRVLRVLTCAHEHLADLLDALR